MAASRSSSNAALSGLRVLEIAQLIAGPMAGSFLADLGADVVHLEDPVRGDPQRVTGVTNEDGTFLWWKVSGRNKRSVTVDLRRPEGQDVARKLAQWADVVVTNFRVETLIKWGLDWSRLHEENPKLILLQISGFGTDTTLRNSPGFGKVGEAMSGVVHLTGFPEGPPVHTGFSHGDSITGLMGAFAVQVALYRKATDPDFAGEWIDLALFESLYRLIEWQVITYDQAHVVPMRAGNQLPVAPAAVINTFMAADDKWVTVTSGTPKSVRKVAAMLGEVPEDYETVGQQFAKSAHLDHLLRAWIAERDADHAIELMREAEVVASRIYSVEDIMNDPTYQERDDIIEIDDAELGPIRMQSVIPKLRNHGGEIWRTGPALGEDTDEVLRDYLNLSSAEIEELRLEGIV